ncbi:MAG: phosphoribosylformylglycinamidine synthase subunit PurQ [Bacteroidota bacterium]
MKFGVITFPGSNCDRDLMISLEHNLGQEVVALWHKDHDLQGCDVICLPGGFSYGDYLRSGAIARFSPIMKEVIKHAKSGGYVLGVCNGFQMLTEAHLLEGALLHNVSTNFICKNVHIRAISKNTVITAHLTDQAYKIPIAHAEGNYYCSADVLKQLQDEDRILFQYCDEEGNVSQKANPNGSLHNIAGICNVGRNVLGMMPHPERATDPLLGNMDGKALFTSLLTSLSAQITV